jgi:hypothetical protein
MRYRLPAITILLLAGSLLWVLMPRKPETAAARSVSDPHSKPQEATQPSVDPSQAETSGATPEVNTTSDQAETIAAEHQRAILAAATETSSGPEVGQGLAPATVLENMRSLFRQYSSRFGGNPVGTNPEITATLTGNNPGHVVFLKPEDGMRLNERGELIDNWGTPYFFHQLSRTEMEIHSAGPDRKMWTSDDLVIR